MTGRSWPLIHRESFRNHWFELLMKTVLMWKYLTSSRVWRSSLPSSWSTSLTAGISSQWEISSVCAGASRERLVEYTVLTKVTNITNINGAERVYSSKSSGFGAVCSTTAVCEDETLLETCSVLYLQIADTLLSVLEFQEIWMTRFLHRHRQFINGWIKERCGC